MGLDVYAGPLTRYYTKNWKSSIQQIAEANNWNFNIVRPGKDVPKEELSVEETKEIIEAWRDNLAIALREHTNSIIFWEENNFNAYKTDKRGWDCYGALILWTLYEEQGMPKPEEFDDDWTENKLFKTSMLEDYKTTYPSITQDCEFWLPIDIDFTFKYDDLSEKRVGIGSSFRLLEDLKKLNENTWKASNEEIKSWRQTIDQNTKLFEEKAKSGFATMYLLAMFSADNKAPIKLDY